MNFPDRKTVELLRKEYPAGTRVILEEMDDVQAPPVGTMGTVIGVDDAGDLLMQWDNGCGLNVVYGQDRVRKMIMTDKVFRYLLKIRDSGATNMFDTNMVQRLAYDQDMYELVMYVEEHKKEYVHFIMYGTEE
ncbi:MAG: DUF4314 domain-containing protein [Spirochaetales bacterium]|nr:DUF4314 domain-containing protein [Spirochaetales bacterium]